VPLALVVRLEARLMLRRKAWAEPNQSVNIRHEIAVAIGAAAVASTEVGLFTPPAWLVVGV